MATEEELEALEKSIEHWTDNVQREKRREKLLLGPSACACCQLQIKRQSLSDADDFLCFSAITGSCPIASFTECEGCDGTPYYDVVCKRRPASAMLEWLLKLHNHIKEPDRNPPPELLKDQPEYPYDYPEM